MFDVLPERRRESSECLVGSLSAYEYRGYSRRAIIPAVWYIAFSGEQSAHSKERELHPFLSHSASSGAKRQYMV